MDKQQEPPSRTAQEPPSRGAQEIFFIGRDRDGHWVVQDQQHLRGGWFVTRDKALRFLRMENGGRLPEIVAVPGVLELDMAGTSVPAERRAA